MAKEERETDSMIQYGGTKVKVKIIRKIHARSSYFGEWKFAWIEQICKLLYNEGSILLKSTLIKNSRIMLGGNVSQLQRGGHVCVSAKVKQARTYIESRSKSPVKHKRSVKL